MNKIRNLITALALAVSTGITPPNVQADGLDDLAQNVAGRIIRHASRATGVYIGETVPSAYITQGQMEKFIGKVKKLIEEGGVGVRYNSGFRPSKIIKDEIPLDVWEYTFSPLSSVNH